MEKRNLYCFPAFPGIRNGYEWAVLSDFKHIKFTSQDVLIFLSEREETNQEDLNLPKGARCYRFKRKSNTLIRLLSCLINCQHPSFFTSSYIRALPREVLDENYDEVFLGDLTFSPLQKRLNAKKIIYRFHNSWLRLFSQIKPNSISNYISVGLLAFTEKRIVKNNNHILTITEKDEAYLKRLNDNISFFGINTDLFPKKRLKYLEDFKESKAVIWLGSVVDHHLKSVLELIKVYKSLKEQYPNLELLMFGKGTKKFNDPRSGIYGFGFYGPVDSFPVTKNYIYVNPDRHGVGIKIKSIDMIKSQLNLLTTPTGILGCEKLVEESNNTYIVEMDNWKDFLLDYFREPSRKESPKNQS